MLCATDCPVFEVKAKISVSIPSGVIRFDYITKKTAFEYLDFLGKCTNVVFFIKPKKGDD